MSLILHAGAEPVTYDQLRSLETPLATATHVPIPHHRIVAAVKNTLGNYGHEVVEENYGLTKDGARFFGVLSLKSLYDGYEDTLGLRNSHDKKFPVGISYGARVFVCDNLSFCGDVVIRRKHTVNAWRDIHGLLAEIVEPLALQRQKQHDTFERYKYTALSDMMTDHAIMELYRQDVINVQRIPEVLEQWERPKHDWGDKNAWRLFNAVTFSLNGRIAEDPSSTQRLHRVIDGVCSTVLH